MKHEKVLTKLAIRLRDYEGSLLSSFFPIYRQMIFYILYYWQFPSFNKEYPLAHCKMFILLFLVILTTFGLPTISLNSQLKARFCLLTELGQAVGCESHERDPDISPWT